MMCLSLRVMRRCCQEQGFLERVVRLCCFSTFVVVLAILLNLGGHRFRSGDFAFNALLVGKVFVFFHVNIWDFNIHVWFFIIIIIINTLPF